jgi:serine phosphatase RsbU (regulator of sigma subunit)
MVHPMKLRAQLALAFLMLAVVPLGAIVFYSYVSSEKAFRQAVWSESNTLTEEMETRLASARQQIKDRIARLSTVEDASPQSLETALDRIGAADLPFVDSLEILPGGAAAGAIEGQPVFLAPRQAAEIRREVAVVLRQAHQHLSEGEARELAARREESKRLVGDLSCPLRTEQGEVARIKAHVKAQSLLDSVFAIRRDQGEVPFALDAARRLYVTRPEDRQRLSGIPLTCDEAAQARMKMPSSPSWVIVTKQVPETGLCFGVARPIRKSLGEMRGAALRSFGYGLGLIGLCFAGIFPLSGRITRNLSGLMDGVERLGRGDLAARVPVRSRDELGRLGEAFNRMAAELSENRERLLEEERLRKEREIERRLLEAEHARKSDELEQARLFQLSLLPRELPRRTDLEIAVYVRTATEVGGDYYDFRQSEDGGLTIAIGDATGHGAAAGTMVTLVKGLFTARGGELPPAELLSHANEVIRRMQLGRMAMALALLRIRGRRLTMASAGMPPLLIHRADRNTVEEVCLHATPLGVFSAMAEPAYPECEADLEPGDTLLLMTDGFPELLSPSGDPLGYPRASELFAAAAGKDPEGVLADLTAAGEQWSAGAPLHDDVTFVVVKVR